MTIALNPSFVSIIDASTELDEFIFGELDWLNLNLKQQEELIHEFVFEALHYHLENCDLYRDYFERKVTNIDSLKLEEIPLIVARMFKFKDILSVDEEDIEQRFMSSGTSGIKSKVPRDRLTIERLLGGVSSSLKLIEDWHEEEIVVINLGPGTEKAGEIWFQYIMSLVELLYESHSMMNDGILAPQKVADLIEQLLKKGKKVAIVGPPFLVFDLCKSDEIRQAEIKAGENLFVFIGGGWKRRSNQEINREEFDRLVTRTFGLSSNRQVRDSFNQVELNTVFVECSHHQKHVPPWVYVSAREPSSLSTLPDGEEGLMSYLDASALSFPAFILTDDVGKVFKGKCECGLEGVRVDISRRLKTRAQKGCALVMERLESSE